MLGGRLPAIIRACMPGPIASTGAIPCGGRAPACSNREVIAELMASCQWPERTKLECEPIGLETQSAGWIKRAAEYRDETLCVTCAGGIPDIGARWQIRGFRECMNDYKGALLGDAWGRGDARWNVWECVRR